MTRHWWGEEAGRGYKLALSQWARWLHAKTRSGKGGPGAMHILPGEAWQPSG